MTRPTAMAPDASTSPVEWGPEIRVNGKRPEWLADDVNLLGQDTGGYYTNDYPGWELEAGAVEWSFAQSIRLPANHPHYYKSPTTPELDPALWDRMVAREVIVPVMSEDDVIDGRFAKYNDYGPLTAITEALRDLGIVREKPVDPDLIEARDLLSHSFVPQDDEAEKLVLRAIKRGRELAAPEVSHVG